MRNDWFLTDTHWFHDNILKFYPKERPFESMEHMLTVYRDNWNSVVKPADVVHHVGDVAFKLFYRENEIDRYLSSLVGQKHLYLGNHDTLPSILTKHFCKIKTWHVFKEHNFLVAHIPIRKQQFRSVDVQVHGHIHASEIDDPQYLNLCPEIMGFKLFHLDEITAMLRTRNMV